MSTVSVVIPCYRYGHFLEECTRSVLTEQPGVDVRVLIIDDASPDGSAEQARAIARRDPRVEVAVHPSNRGHIATYNHGLMDWADGDYCVLLSADDRLTPGALTRAVALLDAVPTAAFAYGHPIHFDPARPLPEARTQSAGWTIWSGQRWLSRRFKDATGCITSPEVVVRTAVQHRVGGYDPQLPSTGDIEMWMRLAAEGDVGYLRGVDQAYYRVHGANMSKTVYAGSVADLVHRKRAFDAILARCGDRLPAADRWAHTVHKKLASDALWEASRAYDRRRTAEVPVDELVAFAEECWPDVRRLPGYATLQLRRRIGPDLMPYLQPLVLSAVGRRVRRELWWRSWRRRGV